jgi:hypothetical protein
MPEGKEQVEVVDHADEARGVLQWTVGDQGPDVLGRDQRVGPALQLAQVHASLAIEERLADITHQLEELNVRLTNA